jgi:predicted PurR-regulated permease PerM
MNVSETSRQDQSQAAPPVKQPDNPERPSAPQPLRRPVPRVTTRIEIPSRTILQIVVTIAAIALVWRLRDIALQILIAGILAAAFAPLVARLQRRGLPKTSAVITVLISFLALVAVIIFLIAQPLVNESQQFIENLPAYIEQAQGILNANQDLYNRIIEAANNVASDPTTVIAPLLTAGRDLVSAVGGFLIVVTMAVYILLEGDRALTWLTRDLAPHNRRKLRHLMPELAQVVSGYVTGQAINSTLFAIFTFVVLSILDVPHPLLLAVVNAFAGAIPIVGVLAATIPAALLALTVSPTTTVIVLGSYLV